MSEKSLAPREGNHGLEIVGIGGQCSVCGFQYAAYRGHLLPCPRCLLERAYPVLVAVSFGVKAGIFTAEIRSKAKQLARELYWVAKK